MNKYSNFNNYGVLTCIRIRNTMTVMDMQTLVKKLHISGLTDKRIAEIASSKDDVVSQSIVNRWRHGIHTKVSYKRYLRLLEYHNKLK